MNRPLLATALLSAVLFGACQTDDDSASSEPKVFNFNFQADTQGWTSGFADYPNEPNVEEFYDLEFSHSVLPSPLNQGDGALRQSGDNHSDDLFMFVKKKITGLNPNTSYDITLEVEFATNAASGAVGVGGAPGESVYIKAGATAIEPLSVLNVSENHFRINIDKGNQSQDGIDMALIGDFSNGTSQFIYVLKELRTTDPIRVKTNPLGECWVIIGTDSGFESTTTIYYNRIEVTVTQP
jgi:hypothetical protein